MFAFLQRLGKSMMLPVSILPIAGILMGVGHFMAPSSMGVNEGETTGIIYDIGLFLNIAGGAIINNIAILFAIGVGIGMSKKNAGIGAMAALASWLVFTTILSSENVEKFVNIDETSALAFASIKNPFIGILSGLIGSFCCNKFSNVKLPQFLAFFSGTRCVPIMSALITVAFSFGFLFIWPVIFNGLVAFGKFILGLGGVGVGIYAFLNRLLIPFGLHHALNNVFWFDTIGIGDLTKYWQGLTSNDVSWSLGMYMAGYFPPIMFGVAGGCLAFVRNSKNPKATLSILGSVALCAFISGVTEPFDFLFVFLAFPLYVIYSILFGIFSVIAYYVNFRAGFSFGAGLIDFIFSCSLPAAQNQWLLIVLGVLAFITFYLVFSLYLKFFKFEIPGSKEPVGSFDKNKKNSNVTKSEKYNLMGQEILKACGGKENIKRADHCITRLRLSVADSEKVNEQLCKDAGATGVVKLGKSEVQIIIGVTVQFVYDAFIDAMNDKLEAEQKQELKQKD